MRQIGFSLPELLLALLIIGEIATFTIPKVLQSQQSSQNKAIGKEFAAMISEAWQIHKYKVGGTANTQAMELTPYFNYVKLDTTSIIDEEPTVGTVSCATQRVCLKLHNGAIVALISDSKFNGTSSTHALLFELDPDGKQSSIEGADYYVYFDGKLRTLGTVVPLTQSYWSGSARTKNPNAALDPSWVDWD